MGGAFILSFIQLLLIAVWLLVLARIVMSWVDPTGRNQVSAFLIQATEPILGPVRRMLPPSGSGLPRPGFPWCMEPGRQKRGCSSWSS